MRHVRSLLRPCFHFFGSVVLLTLLPSLAVTAERIAQQPAASDALYINGELVGYPYAATGGYPARQVTLTSSESNVKWATSVQTSGIVWSPLDFSFAVDMLPGWYNWIAAELGIQQTQQSSVTLLRINGASRASQASGLARLVEIEFPALDRALVGTTRFRARLDFYGQPQVILAPQEPAPAGKPPIGVLLSTQEFRLSLQGLEVATNQAVGVSSFKVTRPGGPSGAGAFSASPIVVRLPQAAATALHEWYAESVLSGTNHPTRRPGLLEYMDGKGHVVASVGLMNVGILGFSPVSHNGFALVEVTLHALQVTAPTAAPVVWQ